MMVSGRSIFEYDNYRLFLRDLYLDAKSRSPKFSFRYFSKMAGFKSPNFLKLVMDGDRNLAPASIEKFAMAFKLGREESIFFRNLVHFNQATTSIERQKFAEALLSSKALRKTQPLKESQFRFFATWYYVLIRELAGLSNFKEDYDWIAKQIRPPISVAEAKRAVEELIKLSLLKRNEAGVLVQTSQNIGTPDEVTSSSIAQCHRSLMQLASEAIDSVAREKRDISAITFTGSEGTALKIKEKIQKFRKELLELASSDSSPDGVYQLNFQFFPLTNMNGDRKL